MSRLAKFAIGMALLVGTPEIVVAAAGCPGGYTPQDGVCKPYQGPYVRRGREYRQRDYDRRDYDRGYGYREYDRGYRRGYHVPGKPCPEGYTVQDGRCRPYTGR
jgi:hypothetical protein